MNRLDSPHSTPAFTVDAFAQAAEGVRQLIVLLPDDLDSMAAIRRVWEWAYAAGARVLLLSLCEDAAREPSLRRRLVRMVSLLQNGNVSAESKIDYGTSWVETVKRNSHPGDVIVCFAGQRAGLWNRPLSQILQARLANPVYIVSDLSPQNPPRPNWTPQLLAWAGSIGIIAGGFAVQVQIVSLFGNEVETTLLILSILAEAWLLGVWNSLLR